MAKNLQTKEDWERSSKEIWQPVSPVSQVPYYIRVSVQLLSWQSGEWSREVQTFLWSLSMLTQECTTRMFPFKSDRKIAVDSHLFLQTICKEFCRLAWWILYCFVFKSPSVSLSQQVICSKSLHLTCSGTSPALCFIFFPSSCSTSAEFRVLDTLQGQGQILDGNHL